MNIGVLREVKPQDNRISLTPSGAELLISRGHKVFVEQNAGSGSGFFDAAYEAVGARILPGPEEVFAKCELLLHVKELQPSEYHLLRPEHTLFSFLHLAPAPDRAKALLDSGAVCLAYETVQNDDGSLPLLRPMSEVAGRLAAQAGARYLERHYGGAGILLGGATGVEPGNVLILGGGVVGFNAAKVAAGMGAKVFLLEQKVSRLNILAALAAPNCFPIMITPEALRQHLQEADVVIGAVLAPGARTPILVDRSMLSTMKRGSVVVDVSVDQGGCFESTRPTTISNPVFMEQGILHYGVTNMAGSVPKTATLAMASASLPYIVELAAKGWQRACRESRELRAGLNVAQGKLTHKAVAEALGMDWSDPRTLT